MKIAILRTEYTDIKDVKHKVEHHTVFDKNNDRRERVVEELFQALTRPGKRVPA